MARGVYTGYESASKTIAVEIVAAFSATEWSVPRFATQSELQQGVEHRSAVRAPDGMAAIRASNLPPGLTIAPATGVISGMPTTVGEYIVTFIAGDLSAPAVQPYHTMTVVPAPELSVAVLPADQVTRLGSVAQFSVVSTNQIDQRFQWFKGGAPLADDGRISGTGSRVIQIANLRDSDQGEYHVVVSGAQSNIASDSVQLTVLRLYSDWAQLPGITGDLTSTFEDGSLGISNAKAYVEGVRPGAVVGGGLRIGMDEGQVALFFDRPVGVGGVISSDLAFRQSLRLVFPRP